MPSLSQLLRFCASTFCLFSLIQLSLASTLARGLPDLWARGSHTNSTDGGSSLLNMLDAFKEGKAIKQALDSEIVPESDFRDPSRVIWIITTASLPWMTGTSINPLLRAAHLAKDRPAGKVHLMVPWLRREEQEIAFPPGVRFDEPEEQREYIMRWLSEQAHMPFTAPKVNITFYAASYHDEFHSVFPMGDITQLIPDELADVCILEEPEHLTWYRAPFTTNKTWIDKFKHVVGIIHTNYLMYTRTYIGGAYKEPLLYLINQGMCRAYCHKIIKLSGALQEFASEKEVIANVHGVRGKYLRIGDASAASKFTKGAYFVGKMAWPKGLDELFRLMSYVEKRTGESFPIDVYGQGPHMHEIRDFATQAKLPVSFFGAKDHSLLAEYKVFVNPSLSEVLCTTIVEALAMGKWVVCAKHPSNEFFEQFPNTLTYRNEEEFAANVFWALHHDPQPLTPEQRYTLSWEAATERLLNASLITRETKQKSDSFGTKIIQWVHEAISSGKHGDTVRFLLGGKSASHQNEWMEKYGSAIPVSSTAAPATAPAAAVAAAVDDSPTPTTTLSTPTSPATTPSAGSSPAPTADPSPSSSSQSIATAWTTTSVGIHDHEQRRERVEGAGGEGKGKDQESLEEGSRASKGYEAEL